MHNKLITNNRIIFCIITISMLEYNCQIQANYAHGETILFRSTLLTIYIYGIILCVFRNECSHTYSIIVLILNEYSHTSSIFVLLLNECSHTLIIIVLLLNECSHASNIVVLLLI